MFRAFAEFVALHYALSHRDETPYWQYLNNKNWAEELISLRPQLIHGFQLAAFDRDKNYRFETEGGLHCIATGMHWSPTDLPSLFYVNCNANIEHWKKDWDNNIFKLEIKKILYNDFVEDVPTLKEYLENNIHVN
tara:strand:- start:358 stop:762 length:405 start_codon:yes stop_codon:yes gene_type:complete